MHVLQKKPKRSIFRKAKRSLYLARKKLSASGAAIKELSVQEDDEINREAAGNIENESHEIKTLNRGVKIAILSVSIGLIVAGIFIGIFQNIYIPSQNYVPPPVIVTPSAHDIIIPVYTGELLPTPFSKVPPKKLYFENRNISCYIQAVGRTADGAMGTVDSAHLAAWYEDGPSPGDSGNALINGHVRWGGLAGTFSILPELTIGEKITFEYENGTQKSFYVKEILVFPYDEVPTYLMSQEGEDRVTLITCHGDWDSSAGTSSQRVFVICTKDEGTV